MKQFTFSAQVANNLLTVLQGYSKTIRLLLVMFLTLTVTTNAWGETVTFTATQSGGWTNTGGAQSGTIDGVTLAVTNGINNGTQLRCYSGATMTISSTNNITEIAVTCTGSGTNNYSPSKFSLSNSTGSYTYSDSGTIGTWEGSATSVSLKASAQVRMTQIVVTYTAAASCTTPPTVSSASNSNITSTTATVSCPIGITSLGSAGCSITSYGFVYGTSSNPTISNTKEQVGTTYTTTSTAFSKELTGLTANTTYYVRPYATNGNGTAYGTQTSFKTLELSKYTVTLKDDNSTLTQSTAGATITLPSRDGCDGYEFVGWTKSWSVAQTTWTTTAPTIISDGSYTPTANESLYPVYTKTEGGGSEPTAYSAGDEGDFVIASYNTSDSKWYAIPETPTLSSSKIAGVEITVSQTAGGVNYVSTANAEGYTWTIADATNGQTISDGTKYIYHSNGGASGTNLAYGTNTSYTWKIEKEDTRLTFKGMSGSTTNSRGLLFNGSVFGGYALSNEDASGYYRIQVLPIGGGSTTSYISVPDCGSTASTYTLTLDSDLSCVTDGSATVELNATELTNFTPATRDGFTCSGYWSAPSGGVKVLNADGTFAATSVQDYITDGKWTNEGNVTLTPRWECSNTMTLSVGTQSGGTYSLSNTSLETCDCTDTKRQVTITATPNSGYSVTDISYSGNGTATKVSGPTVNGNNTEWVYQFNQGDNGNGTFTVTFTTIPTYTITLDAGSGTCDDESLTETSGGAGVTLPTANPPAACATDGWEFAGWWTASVAGTTTSPGELLTAGSNYKPASDCTLYAVYSYTEAGGGGGSQTVTLTNDDIDAAYVGSGDNQTTSYGNHTIVSASGTWGGRITIGNQSGVKYVGISANDENRHLASPIFSANITNITIRGRHNASKTRNIYICSSNTTAKPTSGDIGSGSIASSGVSNQYTNWTNVSIPVSGDYKNFYVYADGGLQIYSIVVTTSGGSTTTYNSNPVCVASWSITYDFAGGTGSHCSNTSVPQGDPYTICDEAPTKEGNTFLHWSDGVNTYNPSDVIATVTTDITLTAVWQPNTYTVTWSDKGVTTPIVYNHGDTLEVPLTDPTPCDGEKEFVGWTEQSGYYHATTAPTDLFKTTTATVTADKTYYAVFATKGEGSANFVLGESGTFKMYANVEGTNYYAQGGVSSNKITSTTEAANASDYTLTYADGVYTIKQGTSNVGNKTGDADLNTNETTWTISEGTNGSWRVTSNVSTSRALSYSTSASAFKAYATSNIESGSYYDIEFGGTSSGYSDYTTTCQQIESIEVQEPQTEFYITDDFTIGSGKVIATLSGGGTTDVTALATFSGYNMNVTGTYTITVTYMGATATYEITVKPLDNAWVLTWNVSGKTNTGLGPRSVTKGSAIGTLPTPEVPAACAGKTFMGWTESNIVPSDGKGIVYITEETEPDDNTTYYAVFATVNNFCTQKPIDQIASGSKVVIVAVASLTDDGGAGKAISSRATDDTYNLQGDDVAIYDQTINTPHSTCIWTITKSGGKYIFTQDGNYLNAISDNGHYNLRYSNTQDTWTITNVVGMVNTYRMQSTVTNYFAEFFKGKFTLYYEANDKGDFDMQFYVTANKDGDADITDYTTGCAEYTITYYGFHGGYSTSCSSDGTIVLPVNSIHTIPDCEGLVINDHTDLGREFLNVWMTQPHGGHTFKPGDTFILTQDTTLYAQWKMETTSDVTTLPTDIEDLAGTDIYVYGGTTLNIQPGTTTINSLTLKGGLQADGSYKMPTVWVPEGATLVRNSNKINLDLIVNAKTYYPFAVPFATKNNQYVEYLDTVLAAASTYGTHFAIKTYNGARRAEVGEDKANNWVRVLRDSTLQPGVGYIITALTLPDKDTSTIRIPMTVPNTWFKNGEQAAVSTTVRNTIAVTAHTGPATDINNGGHQRHAGWNFVANPYLTSFTGGNVANDGGLAYINGELIIEGSYEYTDEEVPYVTIPAYNFAYYDQVKLSDVKLSPEWSFFVQVGNSGTMNFTTAGRQQAPASIAARNVEERPVKMDVDLILSDNHNSDQTGIIISDRYTDAYEIGRDLEKLFGSAYNLSVYTLMEDNTPLAFQALAIRSSMQVIPVGYRAPEQGEYTFRLNEATSSIDLLNEQYEQLVLVDYQTGELTNLLYTDYTFYSERTQSNSRFAIYAVPRQNAPTDLPNAIGSDEEVRKVIYNDHLYILRDGNVYNGMGQKM